MIAWPCFQPRRKPIERQRRTEVVALQSVDPPLRQQPHRIGAGHALGHACEAQVACKLDHRAHDRQRITRCLQVADERPVDLDRRERHVAQRGQRGMSGAEIVERDRKSLQAQPRQHRSRCVRVAHRHAFGDLQPDSAGRRRHSFKHRGHSVREVGRTQARAGDIDGHLDLEPFRGEPLVKRNTGLRHPHRQPVDYVRILFGGGNELLRRHQSQHRVPPADQRFGARHRMYDG